MSTVNKYRLMGIEKTIEEWCTMFPYLWGKDFADKKYQFEEVKDTVPERIKVGKMSCVEGRDVGSGMMWDLQFKTNKHIHYDNAVKLCNVLEDAINSKEEDKDSIKVRASYWKQVHDDLRFLEAELDANHDKKYTQSEVDTIRKDTFCAGLFKGWYNGCFEEDKTYSRKIAEQKYDTYLSSLNNSSDTGKEIVLDNGMGGISVRQEQPSNDAFVWTDELVKEFMDKYNNINSWITGIDPRGEKMAEFKKSKQPLSPSIPDKPDTVTNNDDVPCLSLNDIYHELKMICDGTFGGIHRWSFVLSSEDTPEHFYKKLEQKAKKKLSQPLPDTLELEQKAFYAGQALDTRNGAIEGRDYYPPRYPTFSDYKQQSQSIK